MDSIMRTIVDMDKRARERNSQAKKDLEQVDTEILAQSEAMRKQEQERAKAEIARIKAQNEQRIAHSLDDISAKGAEVSESLDAMYAEKKEQWAQTIAEKALSET